MQPTYLSAPADRHDTPLLVLPIAEGAEGGDFLATVDEELGGAIGRARVAGDLKGRSSDRALFYRDGSEGPRRVLVLGVGKAAEVDAETVRRYAARAVRVAESIGVAGLTIRVEGFASGDSGVDVETAARAAAEGAGLAAWKFEELKTGADAPGDDDSPDVEITTIEISAEGSAEALAAAVEVGAILAEGENFARTLQARPGNVATPVHLAEQARVMGEEVGLEVEIWTMDRIREEGMKALLSVNQGSDEEARFIILRHRGGKPDDRPLALVGKGLTFDAGGISLKPPQKMEEMKFDMSGGAAVLGAMRAIGRLKLPIEVIGVVPSTENLISGRAMKPGDVIGSRKGKTIEVINTDAEGRLILADALAWTSEQGPAAIVDCATLTGACVVALGKHHSGLMSNDDDLAAEVTAAGERSGERCWRLPLGKEYRKQLESDYADLMNVGGREAGTITAGCFLQEFVGEGIPWAHLDIAGTAYGEGKPEYWRKGGHGVPTRLLVEWVRGRTQ